MENIKKPGSSLESIKHLEQITIDCLNRALAVHDNLGAAGEEVVAKNQFGDTALRVDIECEKAVLDFLREKKVPIRVISEEHGQVDIVENPHLLGVLDGLDGSNVYKRERGVGRYATMFGVFDTTDPSYKDYLVSGVMEHARKKLYVAHKNGGAFVTEGGVTTPIHTSGKTRLDSDTRICIDEAYDINKKVFSEKLQEFKPNSRPGLSVGSSAIYYVDTASGAADLALECTRKNNLEIAISYGLITEAGGVVVGMDGKPLADKKYLEFGQKEKLPVITTATKELATDLIQHLNYEKKKRAFFANFALRHLSAFKLHKEFGLLPKEEGWSNVSRHCLVEAVAMDVLAEKLKLSEKDKNNLIQAALLHDFYKRREREKMKEKGTSDATIIEAEKESGNILAEHGIDPEVILLTNSVGHTNIEKMKQPDTTFLEKIMYYIDNVTSSGNIVSLKDRMDPLYKRYPEIAKTGIYAIQLEFAQTIEAEIARKVGLDDPRTLPEYIRTQIRKAVENSV